MWIRDALVNWNNQHWTVLQRDPSQFGVWRHTNSIVNDTLVHGRQNFTDETIIQLFAQIQARCKPGNFSLHRITTSRATGVNYLERESRQAMLAADRAEGDGTGALQESRSSLSLVTMNVNGLAYRNNRHKMHVFLTTLLAKKPDVLMFQEVVEEMYAAPQRMHDFSVVSGAARQSTHSQARRK